MKKIHVLSFLFLVGLPYSAFAVVTGVPVTSGLPEGVCQLVWRFEGRTLQSFCSASLIANDTILTAAHCVDKLTATEKELELQGRKQLGRAVDVVAAVGCSNRVGAPAHVFRAFSAKQVKISGLYSGNGSNHQARNDVALIGFSRESRFSIRPIQVVTKEVDLQALRAKRASCVAVGFGMSQAAENGGLLFAGRVEFPTLNKTGGEITRLDGSARGTTVLPGDSGGPLLCKVPGAKDYLQVGINSKINLKPVVTEVVENGRVVRRSSHAVVERNYFTPTMTPANADFIF